MDDGEFAKRARASGLSKQARFEAAFEQLRRELRSSKMGSALKPPASGFMRRKKSNRPTLSLPSNGTRKIA